MTFISVPVLAAFIKVGLGVQGEEEAGCIITTIFLCQTLVNLNKKCLFSFERKKHVSYQCWISGTPTALTRCQALLGTPGLGRLITQSSLRESPAQDWLGQKPPKRWEQSKAEPLGRKGSHCATWKINWQLMLSGPSQQCIFSNGFSQGLNFKQSKGKIKPSKLIQIRHFWESEEGEGRMQKDSLLRRCH